MNKWIVKAPNGEKVTISLGYGKMIFPHGSIISDKKLAETFPDIFFPLGQLDNELKEVQETVQETEVQETEVQEIAQETEVQETIQETEVQETIQETEVQEIAQETVQETEVQETVQETEVQGIESLDDKKPKKNPKGRRKKQ